MAALPRREDWLAEQRRHRRHALRAPGRFVLDDALEHRCRTIDMSPGGVALMAPTRGDVGQHIVCYLDVFGRLEGRIVRRFENGFAMEIAASAAKRAKLGEHLDWRVERAPATPDPRARRLTPAKPRAILRLPDGRRVGVQLIDLSVSGAALICPVPLWIGAAVTLGTQSAEVVRVAQSVVGLAFDVPLQAASPEDVVAL